MKTRVAVTTAAVVVALVLPFLLDAYWLSTFVFVLIAAIGALGLDVLTGRTGQISLGHAFFLGVGAYVGGFIGADHGLTAALWIPAAGIIAGLLGVIVGPTALRLRGLYLAIVTIGLIYIGQHIFVNVPALTGGPGGRAFVDPAFGGFVFTGGLNVAGLSFDRNGLFYYLALLLLVLAMVFVHNLARSSVGRAMTAVRDGELAAAVLGVNVARTKVAAFGISAGLAGVAGALYGSFLTFAVPTDWNLALSIEYVVMIVVGGMATLWGPVLGALFVIGLPALLQQVSGSQPFFGALQPDDAAAIVYGVILIVFLLLEPRGAVGLAERAINLVKRNRQLSLEPSGG
ncbi:MAG: branched-chain amino acid ABC transporter permease [Chloroflexi bacterium]|nr:branched-chain amino acid ABC transporter permease [Chloroflexota bacterium]